MNLRFALASLLISGSYFVGSSFASIIPIEPASCFDDWLTGSEYIAGFDQQVADQPIREVIAVQQLSTALDAMGGAQAWRSVHGLHTSGSVVSKVRSGDTWVTDSKSFNWTDDWSTGRPRYTRTFGEGQTKHVIRHDGKPGFAVKSGTRTVAAKSPGIASTVVMHLPALALAQLLTDTSVSIREVSAESTDQHRVFETASSDHTILQRWYIGVATGQLGLSNSSLPSPCLSDISTWQRGDISTWQLQSNYIEDLLSDVAPDADTLNASASN